jgi:hypothetical protein
MSIWRFGSCPFGDEWHLALRVLNRGPEVILSGSVPEFIFEAIWNFHAFRPGASSNVVVEIGIDGELV